MNQSYFAQMSKFVLAATSVAILSPIASASATSGFSTTVAQISDNSTGQQLLADKKVETRSRTTIERQTITTESRSSSVSAKGKKTGFSLAIWEPSGNLSEVIARISVKSKGGKGYLKERFLGDYKYKIKQKAKFAKGLKASDRIVVRLYDVQNRFIGYSEFECLSANTTVNLVLSAKPTEYQVVRTVYGVDADQNGTIDAGTITYDYFTQVSDQRVSFLSSSQTFQGSQFQVEGLSTIPGTSVYPVSFTQGEYALVRQSFVSVFSSDLAEALQATPGSLVQVIEVSDNSSYDVSQMLMNYRQVGMSRALQVGFSDVSTNYWAKDFIAELASMQILEGFPDGTFRPDAPVTRAQFAAMLRKAFAKGKIRQAIAFKDVSTQYWAYNAISEVYQMGFLNAVIGKDFNPSQSLSRLDILVALAQGLNYKTSSSTDTILSVYSDATTIRREYRSLIAALTQRGIVVNYPNVKLLNVERVATRSEVSALLYQALSSTGQVANISSQYVVGQQQQQVAAEEQTETSTEGVKPRRHCNQGIGNGSEGCDPGNSHPHGGSNDEGGRTPGNK
ncbi:S-layer homology domain-containing protein [Nostoc sp. UCD121]|uniref:S-layer homology domain-containing protein n=1 Tax=unclassified Nostoc TaxID=2593658 RepID=UPI0016262EDB|nr:MULTISPECIES: S-layer homology domain-containing protein [unclassified Nostoc]MBC1221244.1 S-layer homology domain-containing protein [Nostoc sp. UCD120]MBC1277755.1 S-layer homology domain-containing protein [Nostoc sp. UCD121]MBC1294292.1 S-layer homology domain-containing protein [Nostoc sp. UCD122]